jgi:resuscitation-promoting factor RpfA
MAIRPDDQEIAALYREAESDGPSAALDQAILQAARAAVAAPAAPTGWRRWRLHIPVLASLFMVALFGLLISLEQPDAPGIGQIALNESTPAALAPASTPEQAKSAAPAPVESRAKLAEAAPPRAAAKLADTAREVEMARPTAPPPAAKLAAPAGEAEIARQAVPSIAASAPAANTISSAADAAAPVMDKSEASTPVAARAAARQAAAPVALPVQPASEWLAAIQKLLDEERIAEAKTSLEAFRKVYPAATIPAAMRQRLQILGNREQP